ncbi:uncharacterized protein LOC143209196 [Lasioglossum baleicum]|uniref:uncharacterized protein LOC143209196 n=1 Tax=Lasioglossum baleicum TaxID=434251 RepID=UPI003FCE8A4A
MIDSECIKEDWKIKRGFCTGIENHLSLLRFTPARFFNAAWNLFAYHFQLRRTNVIQFGQCPNEYLNAGSSSLVALLRGFGDRGNRSASKDGAGISRRTACTLVRTLYAKTAAENCTVAASKKKRCEKGWFSGRFERANDVQRVRDPRDSVKSRVKVR